MDKIKCSECDGSGKVECTTCCGSGQKKCRTCNGTGEVSCKSCKGAGHVACPTCGGKGKKYVKCPSCHDGYNIDPDDDRKVKCAKCNGTGKIESGECADCKGSGKIECKTCSGSGKGKCADCKGTGSKPCEDCDGKGNLECEKCHGAGGFSIEEYCKTKIRPDGDIESVDDDVLKVIAHAADGESGAAAYYIACEKKTWRISEFKDEALQYLRKSAKLDFSYGNFQLGRQLCHQDDMDGLSLLQKAADQGCGPAFGLLAMIYYFGKCHQKKDVERAVGYCKKFTGETEPFDGECETWGIAQFMKSLPEAVQGDFEHKHLLAFGAYGEGYRDEAIAMLKRLVADGCDLDAIEGEIDEIAGYLGGEQIESYKREFAELKKKADAAAAKAKEKEQNDKAILAPKSSEPVQAPKSNQSKDAVSAKKRWKFILLGLLFGWMGAHYLYAKRTFLAILLWASFIAGVVLCGKIAAVGGGCIALWALLWLGGTFFVKRDGKGNRM